MGRQGKKTRTAGASTDDAATKWRSLTWDDVDRWAGSRSVSRGRAYQRQGRVKDLVLAKDGRLLASVMGGDRYATSVWLRPGTGRSRSIESTCTCPVGFACKHAVAVVTAFLDALANHEEVPAADPDDPRWRRLSGEDADLDEFGDESDEEEDFDDMTEKGGHPRPGARGVKDVADRHAKPRTRGQWDEAIQSHIRQKGHEELAALVWSFVERFPELRREFQEHIALAQGDVGRLVNQARRELLAVTEEVGWQHRWDDEGHTPDYSGLKHRLERLVEQGHADEVAELGRELIRRGMEQVGQSDDEGETGTELADCLTVVFDAVAKSALSAPDKILYAIDARLCDDYGLIDDVADAILDAKHQPTEWSVVADRLAERLTQMPAGKGEDGFSRNYHRDNVSRWLAQALEHAGRSDECLALYEAEARATGSYERLVKHLIDSGRREDAERWAREGIEKTGAKLPGIAASLANSLCELARRRRKWDVVAAHAAYRFFDRPSVEGFRELVAAAEKAKCAETVRAAALAFLETGKPPFRWSVGAKGKRDVTVDPAWPLPEPDYLAPPPDADARPRGTPRPHYDVLLEMAIADKRPEDVLRWYDKLGAAEKAPIPGWRGWGAVWQSSHSDRVAAAVASTHPERALEIYRRGLNASLTHADTRAYETCAAYLRKMRPILKSLGRETEWTKLLADIRAGYRNRPRFMEILDKLEGQTILQTQKAGRRR